MNAIEAEILTLTGYKPRQNYKSRNEYLICLLREVDGLPQDKFDHLLSNETYNWFKQAEMAFKSYKSLPEFAPISSPEVLSYPRDNEGYTPPAEPELQLSVDEHRGNIVVFLQAQLKASEALDALHDASTKIRAHRISKYRPALPIEGARHYLFAETDRFGVVCGTKRAKAIEALEKGTTMLELKKELGQTFYTLIKEMKAKGHSVINSGGLIKLTHKEDVK